MFSVEIRGADDIDRLIKQIRQHADAKALRKELYAGLNRASKGVRGEMQEAIPASLPKRGGLAARVASTTKFRTAAKSGRFAGVTIWVNNKNYDRRTVTGERLRHPVFGNRSVWVTQEKGVEPRLMIAKFDEQKPAVQRAILQVMDEIAKKLTKG